MHILSIAIHYAHGCCLKKSLKPLFPVSASAASVTTPRVKGITEEDTAPKAVAALAPVVVLVHAVAVASQAPNACPQNL